MKKRYQLPVSGTVYRLRYLQVCVHEPRSRDDPRTGANWDSELMRAQRVLKHSEKQLFY